jgi:hypothetical protein
LQRQRGELRLGKPMMKHANFFYIYILQSERNEGRFYTGLTDDLRQRLKIITRDEFFTPRNGNHGG